MKKVLTGILSSLAVVALCVFMAACSTSFTGTWKFSEMTMSAGGVEQTIKAGKEYNGAKIEKDAIVLEIKDDNTYELKGTMTELMGGAQSGTWEETDGKYYLVAEDGEKQEVTLKGTTLVMENSESGVSVKIKFKK